MTFKFKILTILLFVFFSCSRTIEVPENKVGILYNPKVQDIVLTTGSHTIDYFAGVTLYDISEQKMEFNREFLFTDASSADVAFSIVYVPRVDSLAKICKKYQQPIDYTSISPIVQAEVLSQTRNLLLTLDKDEFDEKQLFQLIENHLKTKSPAVDIIEIREFSRESFNWRYRY